MISSNVQVTDRFPEITVEVEQLSVRALDAAAVVAADTAKRIASQRRRTGKMSDFEPVPAVGTEDGYEAGIRNDPDAWYEHFQNYGTSGKRRKKLKPQSIRSKRSPSGRLRRHRFDARNNPGIEPLGFIEAARRDGRREMLRIIDSGL